ncbi:MAG TPA: glycosyltransferase family 4 protein [Xanthomonadales bacterium]|nr:glycosyltransferase family 4 protein [Xanthomonadales bacterium]
MSVAPLNPFPAWLAATGVLAFLLTGFFTWYARRRGMLDIPSERHSHTVPTPRGGGAGIIAALFIISLALNPDSVAIEYWVRCALPGIVALSLVGWWDDRVGLSAHLRFLVQLLAVFYLSWYLVSTGIAHTPMPALVAVGFVLWMINLYNFMDGSNGMAGFQGVFAGCALTWLFLHAGDNHAALVSALIAAACLGFLPWNLGRARVFMGDVASGSLGFAFAALLVYGVFTASLALPVAWLVMLVFLCDASLTLIARVIRGERWYNPHKQHLYQRLILRGWSHGSVLALYQSINLVLVAPAIAVAVNWPVWAAFMASATTIALGLGWLLVKKNLECSLKAG